MRVLKSVEYKTADQIDAEADIRRREAMSLEPGFARQSGLIEAQKLKQYSLMKRVLTPQADKRRGQDAATKTPSKDHQR